MNEMYISNFCNRQLPRFSPIAVKNWLHFHWESVSSSLVRSLIPKPSSDVYNFLFGVWGDKRCRHGKVINYIRSSLSNKYSCVESIEMSFWDFEYQDKQDKIEKLRLQEIVDRREFDEWKMFTDRSLLEWCSGLEVGQVKWIQCENKCLNLSFQFPALVQIKEVKSIEIKSEVNHYSQQNDYFSPTQISYTMDNYTSKYNYPEHLFNLCRRKWPQYISELNKNLEELMGRSTHREEYELIPIVKDFGAFSQMVNRFRNFKHSLPEFFHPSTDLSFGSLDRHGSNENYYRQDFDKFSYSYHFWLYHLPSLFKQSLQINWCVPIFHFQSPHFFWSLQDKIFVSGKYPIQTTIFLALKTRLYSLEHIKKHFYNVLLPLIYPINMLYIVQNYLDFTTFDLDHAKITIDQ